MPGDDQGNVWGDGDRPGVGLFDFTVEFGPRTQETSALDQLGVTHAQLDFGAAVRSGLGWGMFPQSLAAPHLPDGSFERVTEVHLDVPLFWQCWKLDSPFVKTITDRRKGRRGTASPRHLGSHRDEIRGDD